MYEHVSNHCTTHLNPWAFDYPPKSVNSSIALRPSAPKHLGLFVCSFLRCLISQTSCPGRWPFKHLSRPEKWCIALEPHPHYSWPSWNNHQSIVWCLLINPYWVFNRLFKMVLQDMQKFAIGLFFLEQPLAASTLCWFACFPSLIYVEYHSTIPKVCKVYLLSSAMILTTCEFHRTSNWFSPQTMRIAFSRWKAACTCHMLALLAWQFPVPEVGKRPQNIPWPVTCLSFFGGEKASNKSRTCHPKLTDV